MKPVLYHHRLPQEYAGEYRLLPCVLQAGASRSEGAQLYGHRRYPSIHYTGTEDYFTGSYGFGNDIYTKQYQTFSGHYSVLFAILGDNREFCNGQQRFLLKRFCLLRARLLLI